MNTGPSNSRTAPRDAASRPRQQLLIGTQHPDLGGGVLTMLHAFARWAVQEPALCPAVAYHSMASADPVNAGLFKPPSRRDERWEELPAHCVGRRFRRIEAWHGAGNAAAWRSVLDGYDLHQVVCGYAVTALPQARAGKRFVLWVATSMDGDKRARLASSGWTRRLVHRLQVGTLRRQERFVLERAAWVMALSPHTQTELLERGASASRTSVVRCPIDTTRFVPAASPPACPTVIWSARHNDPRKRTPLLLRAFARARQLVPTARLLLIGEGDAAQFGRLVTELHIEQAVELTGPQPLAHMPELLRRGSIFAIPSEQEGLCIAGLEAMAAGLPVVSTRCGGPETFVLPGRTGLLVDLDDETGLASALGNLLTDEPLRRQLGTGARRLVEDEYGPAAFARQVRDIYATVWSGQVGVVASKS